MAESRNIASPNPDSESAPFWAAAQEGIFLLPRCGDCQTYYWYPRSHCPYCLGGNVEWVQSRGRGRIYSVTVMRRAESLYCVAYVELDEGPRMLTNVETDNPGAVAIGQRVQVVFVPSSDPPHQNIPFFRPVTEHDPQGSAPDGAGRG